MNYCRLLNLVRYKKGFICFEVVDEDIFLVWYILLVVANEFVGFFVYRGVYLFGFLLGINSWLGDDLIVLVLFRAIKWAV